MNIEKIILVVLLVNIFVLSLQMVIQVCVMLKNDQQQGLKVDFVKYISLEVLRRTK